MADVNDYLADYLTPSGMVPLKVDSPPQPQLVTPSPADAAAVANAAANGDASVMLNLASQRGDTLATDNGIVNDFNNPDISYLDFLQKYGPNVTADMGQTSLGNQELLRLTENPRTLGEHITDDTSSVVSGLLGGIGDAATLAAGALNRDAGRYTSQATQRFRDWMSTNTQSTQEQQGRYVSGLRSELDAQDNNKQYEKDKAKGSSFMAGLSYLGRGLVNGASRFVEDPMSLETGLSEGVGSLFAGGALGKGLGIAGKLAGLGKIATQTAMPTAIGLMEGGSAYSGALQEVMGMSTAELMKTSPSFRNLVAGGMDVDQAKEQVAGRAAEIAGAIQAPMGVLTGKLVAGFEAHPLGSKSFRDMVKNILHETIEEGSQSASGQIAQNLGVQEADPTKSILQDVGDQTSQGAILGGLTAGVVQIPSVPGATIRAAATALKNRAKQIDAQNESGSGVTDEEVAASATAASENMAPIADIADKLAENMPEDLRKETDAVNFKSRIENAITVKDEDIKSLGDNTISYFKEKGIEVPKDRINLLQQTARAVVDETSPHDVKLSGALFLLEEMNKQTELFGEHIDEAKSSLDQDSEEYKAISNYQKVLEQIKAHPIMQSAMEWAEKSMTVDLNDNEISSDTASPETVANVIKATTANPSAITPRAANMVLKQAENGTTTVTPEQRKALQNTVSAVQIGEQAAETLNQVNEADPDYTEKVKAVGNEIMNVGGKEKWQLSATQHLARINAALQAGNLDVANAALRHFGNFAWSQRNKAVAAMRSYKQGGKMFFPRLGSYGKRHPIDGDITIHPNNPNSVAFGRRVFIEANAFIDQVNALSDANPDIALPKKLDRLPLPEELFGKSAQPATQDGQQFTEEVKPTEAPSQTETPVSEAPLDGTLDISLEPVTDQVTDQATVETALEQAVNEVLEPKGEEAQQPVTVANANTQQTTGPTAVPSPEEQAPKSKKFPFLVAAKGIANRFLQAFRDEKLSRMLSRGEPLTEFMTALEQASTAIEFLGENPTFDVNPDQRIALMDYLEHGLKLINEGQNSLVYRLRKFSNTLFDEKHPEKGTFGQRIRNGEDVAGTVQGRAMAILEKTATQYRYNPALVQTAMLAAMHWFASSQNRKVSLDKEDVAKLTGMDVSEITNKKVQEFNAGVGLTQAVRSLAESISQFWDLQPHKDASESYVKGIPEALAKEILATMYGNGFMSTAEIEMPNGKKFRQFYFGKNIKPEIRNLLKEMGPARKLIEIAAISPDNRVDATYEKPPENIAPTQMRNRAVRNTRTQRGIIRKAQNIAHYFYRNSYDMQRKIGKDAWIELMGSTVIGEKTPFNEQNKKSVEGRNLTIEMSFDNLEQQVAELEATASNMKLNDVEKVKKFYPFNYSRVNRLQMLGPSNPQSDKIARHVFLPTKATLDLTDPTSKHSTGFWMAVAQGLGVKTQNFTPEGNVLEAHKLLAEDKGLFPLVQELQEWLKNDNQGSLADWSKRLREVHPGITEHGVMTLLTVAEYRNADAAGSLSEFTTHNYFEADGVTNGAANALMNLSTNVTAEWVETVRKGGAFIGHPDRAMHNQSTTSDLYGASGELLAKSQRDFINGLPANVRDVHDALFRIMRGLGMKITFNGDGTITIDRKVLKNPLTITIYGSGIDGIAGNVTNEILDNLYEALSDHLQAGKNAGFGDDLIIPGEAYDAQKFWADLDHVLGNEVIRNEDNSYDVIKPKFFKSTPGVPTNDQLKGLVITPHDFRTMRNNVRMLFVDNMDKAIKETVMGHVGAVVDNIQKATNAQSIVLHYMFRKEMLKELADRQINPSKYPGWKKGDALSQGDMDAILKRLMPYGAVIHTEHQSYFLGAGERSDLLGSTKIKVGEHTYTVRFPESFSKTLFGQFQTNAFAYAPGIAGVAGVPSFNIGTGDGRMIDVFLQNLKGYGVLPVFDGINLPIDRMFEGSQQANAAVSQTWQENPLQAVADSFRGFLRQNPLEQMFDVKDDFNFEIGDFAEALSSNELGVRKPAEIFMLDDMKMFFDDLLEKLDVGAQQIADRIEATKAFPMAVDQMAGTSTPHVQEGTVKLPVNPTDAQIATALQHQMKVVAAARTKGEAIAAPSREFVAAFRAKASTDSATGALVADVNMLQAIRRTLGNKLSNAHREMLNAALANLVDSGLTVVFGTPEMVDRYEYNNYPDTYQNDNSSFNGKIDVENNVIYLTNPSAETLSHELLHASTIHKMVAFYNDAKSVSTDDAEAIQRMEGLMNEWLSLSFDKESPVVGEAHRMAIASIMERLNNGEKAAGLNEFLAWSLSNQNIIKLQKKMQVKNPLFIAMGKAIDALKQLIWGKKAPQLGTDMFSQVRFNARVLMSTPTSVDLILKDYSDVVLYQSQSFGSDPRLSEVRRNFGEQLLAYVKTAQTTDPSRNTAQYALRRQDALEALLRHADIANRMAVPFHMDMQQMSTFKMIGATISTAQHLNSASLSRMQDVFDAVIDRLSPENFKTNLGDPGADEYQALQKYNAVTGVNVTRTDKQGRSSLLPNFIALSVVDDGFRDILRNMDFPAKVMDKSWKADALLDRATNAIASGLATYASGQGRNNVDLLSAMDALSGNLINNIGDQRSFIEQRVNNGLDNADNFVKGYIEKVASKAEAYSQTLTSPFGKRLAKYVKFLARYATEEGTKSLNRTMVSFMNQPEVQHAQRELANEVIGRTEENAPVFDMISRVNTWVAQTRQHWRDDFPALLRKRFSRMLSKNEWSDLHVAFGQTDAASLFKTYRLDRTMELLSSGSERASEIRTLEGRLPQRVIDKAKQLANFMLTGDPGQQIQRNAYNIAKVNQVEDSERDIDNLVTLYALQNLPESTRTSIENLMDTQRQGMEKIYASLVATYNDEKNKSEGGHGRMNGLKGHINAENQDGVHLVIDSRMNHAKYMSMGYVDLGDYVGSSSDVGSDRKGYYFAPVSGRAKFNQGGMQTVQQSQFGVNPDTGFTLGRITAGQITDPRAVAAINRRIQNQTPTTEHLVPVYHPDTGRIIAYERFADPAKLSNLNPTYDLAKSLSAWRGRQSEEGQSRAINEELVDKVHELWNKGQLEHRQNEYVDMSTSTDPVIADAWSVIPRETKAYIKSKFGNHGFMVQRGMLLDVAGARSASVGDLWTGNSRWSPVVQKELRDLIIGFGGNKAYRYLVNAEHAFQQVVTDAKVMIVIKSMIVPAANFVANVYQLSMNGVPIRHIFTGFKKKTFELNQFIKMREQERLLQNDLYVAEGKNDTANIRKLSTRIQTIKDSYKSLSIWPLLEAGEFGAITDGGLSQEDLAISRGGYAAFIEKIISKLPDGPAQDVARYGMVTRDTSLFKAMSRATQYGDFLGKAVLYDDLMRRKKLSSEEALAYVAEEFINFNRFAGRNRAYLESMGMTWFYQFKLRSMKVSQRMLQKHPVRALLHSALTPRIPFLGSVGNPVTDNFLSILMSGKLFNSLGPGQLFRAPHLNPWWNLTT